MSQGGHIAPLVASRRDDLAFVVNVVGGAIPMHEQLVYEERHNIAQMGVPEIIAGLIAVPSAWSIRAIRRRAFWAAIGNFDSVPYWRQVEAPVLTLYGENDTNVPSAESARRLRSLNKPNITVNVYQGSGHALETPRGDDRLIFREDALRDIRDFIHAAGETPPSGQRPGTRDLPHT